MKCEALVLAWYLTHGAGEGREQATYLGATGMGR